MPARLFSQIVKSQDAAVAPTVALSLFGLIAVGGIAFDYARMATMDTELQAAADQAALAAASQLDGKTGTCDRAARAAVNLVANQTAFANETGSNRAIVVPLETACDATGSVKFWQNKTKTTAATNDATAKFVEVTVNSREAFFALTPIVAAMSSGSLGATAFAGLASAICKVPPVMMCNPQETGGNTTFSISPLVGKGLNLVSVGGGSGSWAPGNFGYLDTHGGSNGAPGLRESLGWLNPPGDCSPITGVDTKPGANVNVTDALNSRFDIYDNQSCPSGGLCPPSVNTIKDLLGPSNLTGNNACRIHNSGWREASPANKLYLPNATNSATASTLTPDVMGHPRDMCHASLASAAGHCTGRIGDGVWDRDTYFRANYGWSSANWKTYTALGNTPTRYQVYDWEIAHRGQVIGGQTILSTGNVGSLRNYRKPACSSVQTPSYGSGIAPGGDVADRRRISVAVINCTANNVHGNSTGVPVEKWIDVFLVEPSVSRSSATSGTHGRSGTDAGDIYVEVIGESTAGAGNSNAPAKRDVPYLIE